MRFLKAHTGFTLLETLIALAIMSIAFSAVLMVQSNSLATSSRARQLGFVTTLAKNKMIQSELEVEGKSFTEIKDEEEGTFEKPYEEYKWKREIKEVEFPIIDFSAFAGSGDKKEDQSGGTDALAEKISKLFSKYLKESIREITITIIWKKGSSSRTFSLSTYWVNLNNDFSLTE